MRTDNDGDNKAGKRAFRMDDHRWDGRDDQQRVSNQGNKSANEDGIIATEIGVGHMCTYQGTQIYPEGIEPTLRHGGASSEAVSMA